jgi:hypothetical protein
MCDAMLIKLLNEFMALGGAATTPDVLATMATNIRTNFWMLRISEVIYAISRGMSGKYGKQYGTITYPIVAEYLNAYMEGEREAEITRRREARDAEIKADVITLPDAELYLTAKYTPPEKKEQVEVREQTPEDKAFVALVTFANSFTEKELNRVIQDATTLNWPRVLNRATEILNERKSNSIQSLTTNEK